MTSVKSADSEVKLLIMQLSLSLVTSSLFKYSSRHLVLSIFSPQVRDVVSHPYKTTVKL
jgi:hypothetical protein